ncbi:MAG: valine--tRNA ligase [Saprospiraceae bacterium]
MSLSTRYSPNETEAKWYEHWMEKDYFSSKVDTEKEPFTVVIPPPNVTGVLHMGHMLNNTIQDVLIRKARLEGKNACWVPGTDHASIATEAKVVKMLRERGIKKSDLTRDEFMKYAWEWKEEYGGIILKQLRKLGASCDWKRTRFTMEPKLSDAVLDAFVHLYEKGHIYRGLRMINWDPEAQTVLSNEEVIYKDVTSKLYHVRYKIEDTEDEYVTIATVRPETILGDSAIAVNPKDERFTHLHGKRAIVPMANRSIPIIADRYVDVEFGTGCLKITPAHDPNDYEIGQTHGLETIDILNPNGTMSEAAGFYVGEDRFKARKLIVKDLEEIGALVKIEDYKNKVGHSERTNAVIEPRLSLQWYVNMEELVKPAIKAVETDEVAFLPPKFKNTYNHWMNNIKNWCISRQLWWGQRIPAFYVGEEVFVAKTADEALAKAKEKLNNPNLTVENLRQDDDVLDTWFSSWLWPISVFDGFETREELDYYYPTSVLVTGWDIIFLWVARMIIAGYEFEGKRPFEQVYFTGMVRDKQRRKMSKSLGNSPDALKLIEEFGADGVRFGMLSSAAAGNDLLFDEKLCEQGLAFSNKMWNALRLIKSWEVVEENPNKDSQKLNDLSIAWMQTKLQKELAILEENIQNFRLSEGLMNLRNFIWNEFCSWYLEMVKPVYGEPIDRKTLDATINLYEQMMTALHPFMPFTTEEIWHQLKERQEGEDCIVSTWKTGGEFDAALLKEVEFAQSIVSNIRDIRKKNQLKDREPLTAFIQTSSEAAAILKNDNIHPLLMRLGYLESIEVTENEPESTVSFVTGAEKFYIKIEKEIDVEAERERLTTELERAKKFLIGVTKKLGNERFVNNAPEAVVAKEKQKLVDGEARVKSLEESLAKLG